MTLIDFIQQQRRPARYQPTDFESKASQVFEINEPRI